MRQGGQKAYRPVMAGISYMIGNMLIKGIPFLTLPIFTNLLSTSDFGIYSVYLSYEGIVSILFGLGLNGTTRIARVEFKDSFEDYITSIFALQIIANLVFDVIILSLLHFIYLNEWLNTKMQMILLSNALCTQIYGTAAAKYAICGDVKKNLILSGVMTVINVGASLLLCMFVFPSSAYLGRIYGTYLGAAAVAIYIIVSQYFCCSKIVARRFWKFGIRMGLPLIAHSLSLTILSQCDKIMIQSMDGYDHAGIYSLAVTLLGIVAVVISSIDNAWAPWYYKKLEEGDRQAITKVNNIMVVGFTVFCMVMMLISPELIKLMSNKQYWDSRMVFPPLLISAFFQFIYLFPVNYEYFSKMTGYIATSTVITAVINIILNYILIRFFGYYGAAYATAISKFVLWIMHNRKAKRLGSGELVGKMTAITCSASVSAVCLLTILANDLLIARICMIVFVLTFGARYGYRMGLIQRFKEVWAGRKNR